MGGLDDEVLCTLHVYIEGDMSLMSSLQGIPV